jgi:hypothetical protein
MLPHRCAPRSHQTVSPNGETVCGRYAVRVDVLSSAWHHSAVNKQAHVVLSGDISGHYVVTDRHVTGELTLVPDTSAEAISERVGLVDPTPEEAEAFWRDNEAHMLSPDDEP